MSGLLLAATLATLTAQAPMRADVEVSLATGLGTFASVGGAAQLTVHRQLWEGGGAVRGGVAVGLLAGYQLEDYGAYARSFPGTELTGTTHRIEGLLVVGHDLRLTAADRVLVATQLFVGWTETVRRGSLRNAEVGVSGRYAANGGALCSGVIVRLGLRLTERFSFVAGALLPFPYATAIMPTAILTVGASLRL